MDCCVALGNCFSDLQRQQDPSAWPCAHIVPKQRRARNPLGSLFCSSLHLFLVLFALALLFVGCLLIPAQHRSQAAKNTSPKWRATGQSTRPMPTLAGHLSHWTHLPAASHKLCSNCAQSVASERLSSRPTHLPLAVGKLKLAPPTRRGSAASLLGSVAALGPPQQSTKGSDNHHEDWQGGLPLKLKLARPVTGQADFDAVWLVAGEQTACRRNVVTSCL